MKMFRYISGANEGNVEIEMTIPVSTKWRGDVREMCFYLDEAHQANPPTPTDPAVYIVTRPAMNVYTRYGSGSITESVFKYTQLIYRRVGGYMSDSKWQDEATSLEALIRSNGLDVDTEEFYVNGYNSPMQFWNRRNEVWKVKKN